MAASLYDKQIPPTFLAPTPLVKDIYNIVGSTINASTMNTQTINASTVAGNAVQANTLQCNTVSGSSVQADTLTTNTIVSGTVQGVTRIEDTFPINSASGTIQGEYLSFDFGTSNHYHNKISMFIQDYSAPFFVSFLGSYDNTTWIYLGYAQHSTLPSIPRFNTLTFNYMQINTRYLRMYIWQIFAYARPGTTLFGYGDTRYQTYSSAIRFNNIQILNSNGINIFTDINNLTYSSGLYQGTVWNVYDFELLTNVYQTFDSLQPQEYRGNASISYSQTATGKIVVYTEQAVPTIASNLISGNIIQTNTLYYNTLLCSTFNTIQPKTLGTNTIDFFDDTTTLIIPGAYLTFDLGTEGNTHNRFSHVYSNGSALPLKIHFLESDDNSTWVSLGVVSVINRVPIGDNTTVIYDYTPSTSRYLRAIFIETYSGRTFSINLLWTTISNNNGANLYVSTNQITSTGFTLSITFTRQMSISHPYDYDPVWPPNSTGTYTGTIRTIAYTRTLKKYTGTIAFTTSNIQTNILQVNSLIGSTTQTNILQANRVIASTLQTNSLQANNLVGSTIQTNVLQTSTIIGNTIQPSAFIASTIFGSTLQADIIQVSTLYVSGVASTITTANTIQANLLLFNTIAGNTIQANTYSGSTIIASTMQINQFNIGTLTTSGNTNTFNGMNVNTLTGNAFIASTVRANTMTINSTLIVTTVQTNAINSNNINASTIQTNTLQVSTLLGNQLVGDAIQSIRFNISSITGSTVQTNVLQVSTLIGSTIQLTQLNVSTIMGSTIQMSQLNTSSIVGNMIQTNVLDVSTVVGGTIQVNTLAISTIVGSTIRVTTYLASTITGSTVQANTIQANMISGSSIIGNTIQTSQMTVSTLLGSTIIGNNLQANKIAITDGNNALSTSVANASQLQYIMNLISQACGTGQANTWTAAQTFSASPIFTGLTVSNSPSYILGVNISNQLVRNVISGSVTGLSGTLTSNYIPYASGLTTLSDSPIYRVNATDLAIGQTTSAFPTGTGSSIVSVAGLTQTTSITTTSATFSKIVMADKRSGLNGTLIPGNHGCNFYMGTMENNGTGNYSDVLYLNSWFDATAGNVNVVMFNKNGIGMRIFQGVVSKTSNYTVYTDALLTDINSGNITLGQNSNTNGITFGPNASWSSYLKVGAGINRAAANVAQIIATNGNLYLDCATNTKGLYLNYYVKDVLLNYIFSYTPWTHTGNVSIPGHTLSALGAINSSDRLNIDSSYGLYWSDSDYSRGIVSPERAGNPYGTASTEGKGKGNWSGWGLGSKACWRLYGNGFGLYDNENDDWVVYCSGESDKFCTIAGGSSQMSQNTNRFTCYQNGKDSYGGSFYVNDAGQTNITSDERIKKNIIPIDRNQSIAFINGIIPSLFCLKESKPCIKKDANGKEEIVYPSVCSCEQCGFIAQNILESARQAGLPESTVANTYKYEQELLLPEEERKTLLGVNSMPIISHSVNALKALIEQVEEQQLQINELQRQLLHSETDMNDLYQMAQQQNELLRQLVSI